MQVKIIIGAERAYACIATGTTRMDVALSAGRGAADSLLVTAQEMRQKAERGLSLALLIEKAAHQLRAEADAPAACAPGGAHHTSASHPTEESSGVPHSAVHREAEREALVAVVNQADTFTLSVERLLRCDLPDGMQRPAESTVVQEMYALRASIAQATGEQGERVAHQLATEGKPPALYAVPLAYSLPGHVCTATGRLAMTVADAYARDDSPDRHFWLWDKERETEGLDPWREIDGIDATTATGKDGRPVSYTLDFANGRSEADVAPARVVYMQRTKAEATAAAAGQTAGSAA